MFFIIKSTAQRALRCIRGFIERSPLGTRILRAWVPHVIARLKEFGPYAMMELVLPGGSVLALTVWLYRRRITGRTKVT